MKHTAIGKIIKNNTLYDSSWSQYVSSVGCIDV